MKYIEKTNANDELEYIGLEASKLEDVIIFMKLEEKLPELFHVIKRENFRGDDSVILTIKEKR